MTTASESRPAKGWLARFWTAIDERLGLDALRYKVPDYANTLPYTLGGITFFGFILLVITGVKSKVLLGREYSHAPVAEDVDEVR